MITATTSRRNPEKGKSETSKYLEDVKTVTMQVPQSNGVRIKLYK